MKKRNSKTFAHLTKRHRHCRGLLFKIFSSFLFYISAAKKSRDKIEFCKKMRTSLLPFTKLKKHKDYEITEHIVHKKEVCPECRYKKCGKISRVRIPNMLKEESQYEPHVQATVLELMNVASVPAKGLKRFHADMGKHCLTMPCCTFVWENAILRMMF